MSKGIDCAKPLTVETAPAVKADGYDFVGRYLVPAKGSLRWKALTKKEAEIICNAGLRLLTVYETTADRPRGGSAYGTVDGKSARECAEAIGMPRNGVIYFAVDYQTSDFGTVEAYMRAAAQQIAPYRLGVYGSYSVVEAMRSRGVTNHLWQCVAWSYRMVSPHYSVYQHTAGASVAGVAVDINDCPDMDRAGLWMYQREEDEDEMDIGKLLDEMTDKQAWQLVEKANRYAATLEPSKYAWDACKAGVESGLFSDGNKDGLVDNPQAFVKRQEMATVLYRAGITKKK